MLHCMDISRNRVQTPTHCDWSERAANRIECLGAILNDFDLE